MELIFRRPPVPPAHERTHARLAPNAANMHPKAAPQHLDRNPRHDCRQVRGRFGNIARKVLGHGKRVEFDRTRPDAGQGPRDRGREHQPNAVHVTFPGGAQGRVLRGDANHGDQAAVAGRVGLYLSGPHAGRGAVWPAEPLDDELHRERRS